MAGIEEHIKAIEEAWEFMTPEERDTVRVQLRLILYAANLRSTLKKMNARITSLEDALTQAVKMCRKCHGSGWSVIREYFHNEPCNKTECVRARTVLAAK